MTTFHVIADEQEETNKPTKIPGGDTTNNDELITVKSVNYSGKPLTQSQEKRIDTSALNGLRGILAVHIMIYHSFEFSPLEWNLLGSVQMPLFMVLSGFILSLNEGRKRLYSKTKCCSELIMDRNDDNKFNGMHFYQRRFARTIPLYYLTNFMCIPLIYVGYSFMVTPGIMSYLSYIFTVFAVSCWCGPFILNVPSWFVSTVWFFYWIFPSLLPKLQRYSSQEKKSWIRYHYILQIVIGLVLFVGLLFVPGFSPFAFNFATMWPPSRVTVFIMGILAGLLRNESIPITDHDPTLPTTNHLAICMSLIIIVCSVLETVTKLEVINFGFVAAGINFGLLSPLWLQLILVWWQLQFVYALTCESDDAHSATYKLLTRKYALFLGRISYSLYLVHFPLMQYICWIINGTQSQPKCDKDSSVQCNHEWDTYSGNRLMPTWCIPIHLAVSIIAAILLTICFEEPMRKYLRPKKKTIVSVYNSCK